jgi:putative ABC transport system permease protein
MDTLLQDLRQGVRQLLRAPGIFAVAVLTLALGIGASTAIFSVVRGVLLRPLEYRDPGRLVAIFSAERGGAETRNPSSPANFLDWSAQSRTVDQMTAAQPWSPTLTGSDAPVQLSALKATPSLFSLLGVQPMLGRTFPPGEVVGGPDHVVVLGYSLWERQFGADRGIVGRSIVLNGEGYTVIGVMPREFQFPPFWATGAEMWVPLTFTPDAAGVRGANFLRVFGRLRPGATLEQARGEMEAIAGRLRAEYPRQNEGLGINVESLREPVVSGARPALLALLGAVGLLLLISCANVANLMAGRAAARQRETSVRSALGAGRRRLIRQWVTESILLSLVGGAAGSLLAVWAIDSLIAISPKGFPRLDEIRPDATVLAYALILALAIGVILGLIPALQSSRPDLMGPLRGRSRDTGLRKLRRALAGFEIALALVLLVGATLLTRSLLRTLHVDPGFQTEGRLTMKLSLAGSSHSGSEQQRRFFPELVERVEALPGVESAGVVNHLPISGDLWRSELAVEGRPARPGESIATSYRVVTPRLFETLGTALLKGRGLEESDSKDAVPVALVNQTLADRTWPGEDPLGKRIRIGGSDSNDPWVTVVGVVRDIKQSSLVDPVIPEIYFPYGQNPVDWFQEATLVVHHAPGASRLAAAIRDEVAAIDRSVPVSSPLTLDQVLAEHLRRQRLTSALFGAFALTALTLCLVGVYGVVSYFVGQRTHEIGIRLALGSSRTEIIRLILGENVALAGMAVGCGVVVGLVITRFMGSLLFGISPSDPVTFGGASVLLLLVALLASYLPARRATRVDPMVALRAE